MAWLRAMAVWMAYVATVLLAIPARAAEDGDGTASEVPSPDARKMHLAEALAISAADILDDQETPAVEGYDALSDLLESAVVAESFTYWELAQAVHDVLLQQGYNEEVMAASDGASSLSCSIWKGQAYQPRLSSVQIEISDDWGRGSTCVNGHWKSWGYGSGWAAAANTGDLNGSKCPGRASATHSHCYQLADCGGTISADGWSHWRPDAWWSLDPWSRTATALQQST
ncbi:unnamed protein product [Symbiodinium natans]|uniref:Uncharacterized protein n=1 Tax=Symbiodinium natans TaxID=878477 RepID=A0A812GDU2_9DINO|nr:unnamed protein product [Symbiodinium natans]